MFSDRALRSIAQAYRWLIAGIAGAAASLILDLDLPPFHPFTWVFVAIIFVILLVVLGMVEYMIQGQLDPDIETSGDRQRNR